MQILNIEPTVFFIRDGTGLRQQVRITVINAADAVSATLVVRSAGGVDECLTLEYVGVGETEQEVYLPDLRSPVELTFALYAAAQIQDRRVMKWTPQKHWEIHMVHFSHHDLGYSDMPTELQEEHAGFMDQVLDFCEANANWPEESQFRWLSEETWSVLPSWRAVPERRQSAWRTSFGAGRSRSVPYTGTRFRSCAAMKR